VRVGYRQENMSGATRAEDVSGVCVCVCVYVCVCVRVCVYVCVRARVREVVGRADGSDGGQ
jgi:hypothetical protein